MSAPADVVGSAPSHLGAAADKSGSESFSWLTRIGADSSSSSSSVTYRITFRFCPMLLRLRHAFGTSHSSSATRTNALFSLTVTSVNGTTSADAAAVRSFAVGYGESGLPPKKPKCYLADIDDCRAVFQRTVAAICRTQRESSSPPDEANKEEDATVEEGLKWLLEEMPPHLQSYSPFAEVQQTAAKLSSSSSDSSWLFPEDIVRHRSPFLHELFRRLFFILDTTTSEPGDRAAKSGIEACFFDCWSKLLSIPFAEFMGHRRCLEMCATKSLAKHATRSFYTAALNDDVNEIVESAQFGSAYTPALKIKVNDDLPHCRTILRTLREKKIGSVWSIDANAAWTNPTVAESFVVMLSDFLKEQQQQVYMIEQPWGVDFVPGVDPEVDRQWSAFRQQVNRLSSSSSCGGDGDDHDVYLYADESISTECDVVTFQKYVDGVNIKIEKTGGIREALKAVFTARQLGLRVWIGTMVSTCLGCTQAAHVALFADDSDVDGGLLVFPDCFDGGFSWEARSGVVTLTGINHSLNGMTTTNTMPHQDDCGFGVKKLTL